MASRLDQNAIRAVFALAASDGGFDPDFAAYLATIRHNRPVLLLAFAPKAAGTFLRGAAIEATGGQLVRISHAQGGRDAQPYLPLFVNYLTGGVCEGPMVAHAHMQGFAANRRFCEAFDLKPIVMLRSISDMLASTRDMLDADPQARIDSLNCQVPEDFSARGAEEKSDFLIDMYAPWYVSYFASWLDYAQSDARVLLVDFSAFKADPAAVLARMLDHAGLAQPLEVCRAALDGVWRERQSLRFNKGVAGRGRDYFSPEHFARLERMMARYPVLASMRDALL